MKTVVFKTKRIKADADTPNSFSLTAPNGTVTVTGESDFVVKILRQLLEHPESTVANEFAVAYEALSPAQQKRFRKFFKIGEFSNPDNVCWPAWLE